MNDLARYAAETFVFLNGGGEMGKLIHKHNWSAPSLGPLESWPQSLRVILGFLLRSPVPMVLLWGEDGVMLYNDAYSVFAGSRHPELLGRKVRDGWPEVVAFNDNVMKVVLAGGTLHYRGQELVLYRSGQPERVWMNLDYSPVLDASGEPAGVLCVVAEITEQIAAEQRRVAAEAALRAERDRSQRVLDNMGEAFVLLDREFRIIDMNAEAMRLENRPKEAILGKTHWEAHPDAAPELGELYRTAMREKRAVALEHRYVWSDGRDTWIDMRAYPVGDELAVFYRDVTDRKRTEEALRASDDRQRFLISLDNEVRRLVEPGAVIAATSRALGEQLGVARVAFAEIDEANDRASVHDGWTDGTLAPLPDKLKLSDFGPTMIGALKAGTTVRADDAATDPGTADGMASLGAIGVRALVSVPLVKDGRLLLNLNVHRLEPHTWTKAEIELIEAVAERTWGAVERAQAEAALRESEAQFRLMADAVPQIVWVTDAEGRVEFFNKQWSDYTGAPYEPTTAAAVAGNHVHPDDGVATIAAFEEAQRSGRTFSVEHRIRSASGEYRWFLVRAEPYRDRKTGEIARWFGASIDIHDRRLAEAALRASEGRLSFLDRLGAETAALADADAVLEATTRLLGEHLGVSICAYADMDEDEDGFTIRGDWVAPGSRSIVGHYSLPDFGQLAVKNLSAGLPLVVNNNLRELAPEEAATFQSIGIAATICMPLVKEGRLTALMAIHDRVPRVWTLEELALLREVTARSWAHVERVGATAELRESEAQFRAFAQAVPNHVWAARPDGALYWFNDQVYAYCGEPQGSLDGTEWARIVHPDDRQDAAVTWARALAEGQVYETEFRIRRGDDVYRWFLVRAEPVRGASGAISHWVGTNTDIHDRRRAEEALRDLNETLETRVAERTAERDRLWRNTQDIQVVIDEAGVFQAVSPAFTHILGWPAQEVIGRTVFDFIVPEDDELTHAALEHARRDTLPVVENRYRHKDGSVRWISWVASPEGGLIYASGRHITEHKEQAAALAQAEDALRQSQKMEAVGQLTGGLAHDFNNLLAGISGSLELMATRIKQGRLEEVERYMVAAQGAARRAAALTHRLLAFSRRQTLAPKVTGLNALVTGMEELIRRTVGPEVVVESVTGTGIWDVEVDPNQLENALLNLSINARDAMPEGGRITIETANRWMDARAAREQELSPGQYVSLSVSDTGTGMPADVVARAFDPFFTTKPLGVGTGLGLSMVYGFARQSGGQVRIYSEVGQGTTVCLYLPRYQGHDHTQDASSEIETGVPTGAGETVLVIDDEPVVRMLIADVLEELGYYVTEASDGPEGLSVLQSKARIDLLITDVGLPGGLNGRQVADAARVLRPELKVLFITGYAENAVVGQGRLEPGMHVVTKPFAVEELARRIRSILSGD